MDYYERQLPPTALRQTNGYSLASAVRSTNPHDHIFDGQLQLFHSFNTTPPSHLNMKLAKMTSLSNLLSSKRGADPSTPSSGGRGNFDKVLDISPLKTPKENVPPFTPSVRVYRTPLAPSFPQNDAKDHGNFLDLAPPKSSSFFRLPSPRLKSRKDEPLRPEHISRPRPSPHSTTSSFAVTPTPSDDYFSHRATGRVERYGEHVPVPSPKSHQHRHPRTGAPQLSSYKSTPALAARHRAHAKVPSNKNPRPDVPMNALDYEREHEADLADSPFDPAMSGWDRVYHFKDLPGRESEVKPVMLVERMGDKVSDSPRYSFDNLSLAANHGIESSTYCF